MNAFRIPGKLSTFHLRSLICSSKVCYEVSTTIILILYIRKKELEELQQSAQGTKPVWLPTEN